VGLPGAWTVLLLRAVVVHPAGCDLPSPYSGKPAVAFGSCNALGTRDDIVFVAAFPTAHSLARLRIAGRVAATVARLATGWAGSPFAGRGLHPLDDEPNFIRSSQSHSFRTSLAWSHCTGYPPRWLNEMEDPEWVAV
jgi:hypothetical protein